MICIKVRGQLCGTGSPFSPACVSWGLNSDLHVVRTVQQVSLPKTHTAGLKPATLLLHQLGVNCRHLGPPTATNVDSYV